MATFDIDKINSLLDELKLLPKIREVRELINRLTREKQKLVIEEKIPVPKPKSDANLTRASFMKGVWKYVKLIYDRYPQLREQYTIKEVFSQFFARRRGEDVEIKDVIWQNASG